MKARIETGRLKINSVRCPNLLAEARHYRREEGSETPVDEYNHALGALRYMISRIDSRFMARLRRQRTAEGLLPEIEEVTDEDRE